MSRAEGGARRLRLGGGVGVAEAAEVAFAGLREALDGPDRFSLEDEIVRVRVDSESEHDHWHGWAPRCEGAEPLTADEPMVAIVHGILRRGELVRFLRNNAHAASRAAHHRAPRKHRHLLEAAVHTSISLWQT